jgi:O-antigen/teichoic acid export membrane protein
MAQDRFGAVALLQITQPATYVVLIVVFWLFGIASVATVIIAFICGNVANFVAGLLLTNASLFRKGMSFRPLLARSFDYYGGSVSQIASTRLDQVIALPLIGAVQAGYYSVAVTIGSAAPLVLGHALGGSNFRGIARAEGDERTELEAAAFRSACALALMFCPLVALISWPLMPIIFGSEFEAALPATLIAIGAGGVQLVAFVTSSSTTARGRGKLLTLAQCVGLAVGVLALLIAGQTAGAVGAAIASALGFASTTLILAASLRVKPSRLLPRASDFPASIRQLLRR